MTIRSFKNFQHTALLCLALAFAFTASQTMAQDQPPPGAQGQVNGRAMPPFGKITAIHDNSIDLERPDGSKLTVKITDKTEFRKDRQPAKRADFKVGDFVFVRGTENEDHTWSAESVAGRTGNAQGGGPGGAQFFGPQGTMGKDYVFGEIKAVDPPKITITLPDNNVQTIELNEETSLHKGRDAVTMADIKVGDHLFATGGVQNNVFVPKNVQIIDAERWKRMQEMRNGGPPPPGQNQPPKNPNGAA
jgi:Cu/Ag efflux protein CusF